MNIQIVHIKRASNIPQAQIIYLARGPSNRSYPNLANDYTHKDNTKAKYKVKTVEEAVTWYTKDLVEAILNDQGTIRSQMRSLYEQTIELYKHFGVVYYACWCMHEPDPKPWDHACHCVTLRHLILTKYKKEHK